MADTDDMDWKEQCTTQVKESRGSFLWTIDNFYSYHLDMQESLTSSVFSVEPDAGPKWRATLTHHISTYSICLALQSCTAWTGAMKATFYLRNAELSKSFVMNWSCERREFVAEQDSNLKSYIGVGDLRGNPDFYLPGDKLSVVCGVSVFSEPVNISVSLSSLPDSEQVSQLVEDMKLLFEDKELSDVTLTVSDKTIQAHKNILSARSSVFAAMFSHNMKEKQENGVVIKDIEYPVLCEMLRFIYTARVENLDTLAADLFVAADKYSIESLKAICVAALHRTLSVDSVLRTVILAEYHNINNLKMKCIDFIKSNAAAVMESGGWKDLFHCHSTLAMDIVHFLVPAPPPKK